jgi:hypothetical protein
MLESGTYEKLAEANGLAINGLQPKITMWNTGKSSITGTQFFYLTLEIEGTKHLID